MSRLLAVGSTLLGLYGALVVVPGEAPSGLDLVAAVHSFPGVVAIGSNDGPTGVRSRPARPSGGGS